MRENLYHHKKVVIGNDLSSLIYAHENNLPILQNGLKRPYFFESGEDVWERLNFSLSLAGKKILPKPSESVRINSNEVFAVTKDGFSCRFQFDNLIIFNDDHIQGLDQPSRRVGDMDKRMVVDWYNVRSGMCHDLKKIETDDNFVNTVHFYPSSRIPGNHDRKDLISVSYLTKKEINSIDYSNIYVKFKILSLMKGEGIRGKRNGRDTKNKKLFKYYALDIEHEKREIREITKNKYDSNERIQFMDSVEYSNNNMSFGETGQYLYKLGNALCEEN